MKTAAQIRGGCLNQERRTVPVCQPVAEDIDVRPSTQRLDSRRDRIPVDIRRHVTPRHPNRAGDRVLRKTHRLEDMARRVALRRAR